MRLKLYAIHDQAVKEFIGPEVCKTHAEAERKFRMNVNKEENGFLYANPENFNLYHIGDYDTEKGQLLPLNEPQHIMSAVQCKETKGS